MVCICSICKPCTRYLYMSMICVCIVPSPFPFRPFVGLTLLPCPMDTCVVYIYHLRHTCVTPVLRVLHEYGGGHYASFTNIVRHTGRSVMLIWDRSKRAPSTPNISKPSAPLLFRPSLFSSSRTFWADPLSIGRAFELHTIQVKPFDDTPLVAAFDHVAVCHILAHAIDGLVLVIVSKLVY